MGLVEVRGLKVAYGMVQALAGVSLSVDAGEIVSLVGANGAGKSTLMKAIMGVVRPAAGEILFDGKRIDALPTHRIANLGIAWVPEGRATLKHMSVRENLLLGAYSRGRDPAIAQDLEQVLVRFPALRPRIEQVAGTLSGGEQQMVVIGRALMSRPRVLLLDEPSLGLAPLISREIFRSLARLSNEGMTVLLVEQNASAALALAPRGYVLEMGRIVLEGSGLANDERVKQAYLGELEVASPVPPPQ